MSVHAEQAEDVVSHPRHTREQRLAWQRAGEGHARRLFVLHDAGADTLGARVFEDLAADHDVVQVHLPGYGASALAARGGGIAAVVADLEDVLHTLGWREAVTVAGTSLGGWFALELALARPARVARLVLADAAGLHWPPDFLLTLYEQGQAAIAAAAPPLATIAAAAACGFNAYTPNPLQLARLGGVRCPTVVLWGERDTLIPREHGVLLAAGIPGARLDLVGGAGHLVARDAPERFAAAIRNV